MSELFKRRMLQVYGLVASRKFFIIVLALVFIQGLLYTVSFKPYLFDEQRHIDFISFYADTGDPFVEVQTPSMDPLGQVTREPSYAYYYLMSIIVRVVGLITDSSTTQVIVLRLVNVGIFIFSLLILRRVFREMSISPAVTNVTMLVYATIPAVGALIGAVTYDIGVLPFIFGLLLTTIWIVKQKKINISHLALFYLIVCVGSVVKYTSIPVAVACTAIILSHIIISYRYKFKRLALDAKKQLLAVSRIKLFVAIMVGLVLTGIVLERPLQNVLSYNGISPNCLDTLPEKTAVERCSKNYVYKRNVDFLAVKPDNFTPVDFLQYGLSTWIPGMLQTSVQQYPDVGPLPIMKLLFYTLFLVGPALILIALKDLLRQNKLLLIFIFVSVAYVASVAYSNYKGYVDLGQPVAISARYLLPVIPLFLCLLVLSVRILIARYRTLIASSMVIVYVLLITQGGGIITHLMSVNKNDYWQQKGIVQVNQSVKSVLKVLVKN